MFVDDLVIDSFYFVEGSVSVESTGIAKSGLYCSCAFSLIETYNPFNKQAGILCPLLTRVILRTSWNIKPCTARNFCHRGLVGCDNQTAGSHRFCNRPAKSLSLRRE